MRENACNFFCYVIGSVASHSVLPVKMQSRQPSLPQPTPTPPPVLHRTGHTTLLTPVGATAAALSLLIFLAVLYRRLSRSRTAPADLKQLRRFSYSRLRRATSSFSPERRLGQGGFGSVYRATLPSGTDVAVKLMDVGSLQGEREFENELSLANQISGSDRVVSLIGFCSDRRRRRLLLVYELMPNGSLQDALLDRRCPELAVWARRFSIAVQIAQALDFLHVACNPPIIHGDIKPSNILLDSSFSAKIADFGLASVKSDDQMVQINPPPFDLKSGNPAVQVDPPGLKSDVKSEELAVQIDPPSPDLKSDDLTVHVDLSPFHRDSAGGGGASPKGKEADHENGSITEEASELSPERSPYAASASPETMVTAASASDGCFDRFSIESGGQRGGARKKSVSGKDWWWRQDLSNEEITDSSGVKDYVMEWIGSEIKKERPKSDWIVSDDKSKPSIVRSDSRKKQQRRLEWWASLDEGRSWKKDKTRPPREWWREEFCEELSKKKKKPKSLGGTNAGIAEQWWQKDDNLDDNHDTNLQDLKKKKKRRSWSRSRGSRSSIDWWMDGLSGEFRFGRRSSLDWMSGDIPKSVGVSSTPSMRGTVCYIAPEYGGGGSLSEKCDVYSFGVLLLVLVSGRRPLQVTASPMSEFERANLISWARHLARIGKLLDLVDPSIQCLDSEQALLCITVALLCLQRSPVHRPTIKEALRMLAGESELPHLPVDFSPSPRSGFKFKSRKKGR